MIEFVDGVDLQFTFRPAGYKYRDGRATEIQQRILGAIRERKNAAIRNITFTPSEIVITMPLLVEMTVPMIEEFRASLSTEIEAIVGPAPKFEDD